MTTHALYFGKTLIWVISALVFIEPATAQQPPAIRTASPEEQAQIRRDEDSVHQSMQKNDWYQAEKECRILIEYANQFVKDSSIDMCYYRTLLAKALLQQEKYTETSVLLRPVLEPLRRHDLAKIANADELPQALYILASAEANGLELGYALRLCDEALDLLRVRKLPKDDLTALLLLLRGKIVAAFDDYLNAQNDLDSALMIAVSLSHRTPQLEGSINESLAAVWSSKSDEAWSMGQFGLAKDSLTKAEEYLTRADNCYKLLKDSPHKTRRLSIVAESRQSLSGLKEDMSSVTKISPFMRTPLLLFVRPSRNSPADLAIMRNRDAVTLAAAGKYDQADLLLTQAVEAIQHQPRTTMNDRVLVMCMKNQAILRVVFLNRQNEGVVQAKTALDIVYLATVRDCAFLSQRQQQRLALRGETALSDYISLSILAHVPAAEIYNNVVKWKGILFAMNSIQNRTQYRQEVEQLKIAEETLLAQLRRLNESENPAVLDIQTAREMLEVAQRKLADYQLIEAKQILLQVPTSTDVINKLSAGTVLVDYASYHDFVTAKDSAIASGRGLQFIAFILESGNKNIAMVPLPTPTIELNRMILVWRELLVKSAANASLEPRYDEITAQISNGIWKPIEPYCREARHLNVCPHGWIWAFPFSALPGHSSKYLISEKSITYTYAARNAYKKAKTDPRSSEGPDDGYLILSGIDYGTKLPNVQGSSEVAQVLASRLRSESTKYLSGQLDKSILLQYIKNYGSNVCYVGHGVEHKRISVLEVEKYGLTMIAPASQVEELLSDPLDYCFPINGAAHTSNADKRRNMEYWIFQDELTQAVPPNAERFEFWGCSSFLGPIHPTEGMMSFPRSLLMGGYRTVVSAQWNVPISTAIPFIPNQFHKAIFDDGVDEAVALQKAQCAAINLGGVNAHPYHWAAWMIVGNTTGTVHVLNQIKSPPNANTYFPWYMLILAVIAMTFVAHRSRQARRENFR